jgi:hypothetical protein
VGRNYKHLYIYNKQGLPHLSQEVEDFGDLCLERGISLKARYVQGVDLKEADFYSRVKLRDSELRLPTSKFEKICQIWKIEIDLFACFYCQTKNFVSHLILITPHWAGATWWPDLKELSTVQPIKNPGIIRI